MATINAIGSNKPIEVPFGGTGDASVTAFAPICGGTTTTGAFQSASTGISTSGFILTSTGASSLPTFQAPAASSISITGDTGGTLTGASFTFAGGTTGLSFGGSGSTETLTFAGITANGGTVSLATDATTSTINIGTGAGAKTSTFGSTNTTSATTLQSGSGALNITATNGALTINSGTGALGISTDASATTVSFATGAAVKTVTLGSTNTTSSTAIKSGSGNVAINSGLTIDSTGRNYNTVQPAFFAFLSATASNVTGDATIYTLAANTEVFDQGSNYDNSTFTFTAPITGKYYLGCATVASGITTSYTTYQLQVVTSNFNASNGAYFGPGKSFASGGFSGGNMSALFDMDAADTAKFTLIVSGSTKNVSAVGGRDFTYVFGNLVC